MNLFMWGTTSAGKTIFLTQLFLHVQAGKEWLVRAEGNAVIDRVKRLAERMRGENAFPPPTTVGEGEDLSFVLVERRSNRSALVRIRDRAGRESEDLQEASFKLLREAHGLLLMLDPEREKNSLFTELQLALMRLDNDRRQQAAHREQYQDPRPIAVCLTKADLYLKTPDDVLRVRQTPDAFVKQHLDPRILDLIDQYFERARLFPVSSVGVRVIPGLVEPVLFLDEQLGVRIAHLGTPINVIEPFAWLFDQLRDAHADGKGAPSA